MDLLLIAHWQKLTKPMIVVLIFAIMGPMLTEQYTNPLPNRNLKPDSNNYPPPPYVSPQLQDQAFAEATRMQNSRNALINNLYNEGQFIRPGQITATGRHQENNHATALALQRENTADRFQDATTVIAQRMGLSGRDNIRSLQGVTPQGRTAQQAFANCRNQMAVDCSNSAPSRYRTIDGSCNNLQNPSWGQAFTCFARVLPPDYADGISEPRASRFGYPLPNARAISLVMSPDINRPARAWTHMMMMWGQFIDHDLTLGPASRQLNNTGIQCCPVTPGVPQHPQCFPIAISPNDPFYSQFGQTCMNFVRGVPCPTCTFGPRQHVNQITAFIDASMVYGSTDDVLASVRTPGSAFLQVSFASNGLPLLPPSNNPTTDQCSRPQQNLLCFRAGDIRVNQHPALAGMHVIWLRQHNRIASILRNLNPRWDSETLFQEARRIVGAQMQVITYNEYLPEVIGEERMNYFGLNAPFIGQTDYVPGTEPSMTYEFSSSAFRFGHSTVQGLFSLLSPNGQNGAYELRNNFFTPYVLFNNTLDPIMLGLSADPPQEFDEFFVTDVTRHLYKQREAPFGLDLVAVNIQRGRDHGLPSYTEHVKACYGDVITSFDGLRNYMRDSSIQKLRSIYQRVEDIDMYMGQFTEVSIPGAAVGPTVACFVGMQFHHMLYGDRYFFSHRRQAGSFTFGQYKELLKTTLAKVICENSDGIPALQPRVILPVRPGNPLTRCEALPSPNWGLWRTGVY